MNGGDKEEPPEAPQEPQNPTENDGNINQPHTPETPPEDNESGKNDYDVTVGSGSQEELENPTQEPQTPAHETQKPTQEHESGNNKDDGYTPPIWVRPSRTDDTPVEVESSRIILQCGKAVIDVFRSAVLYGYGDGLLHEDDPLTRAQMATLIFRILDDESTSVLSKPINSFNDVETDAWCAPYILALADAGVVNGTGNGCFCPNSATTWAQLLTVLGRFVEPQEYDLQYIQYDGWARQAIETAVALGWIEDSAAINPNAVITRREAVALINVILEMSR